MESPRWPSIFGHRGLSPGFNPAEKVEVFDTATHFQGLDEWCLNVVMPCLFHGFKAICQATFKQRLYNLSTIEIDCVSSSIFH